MIQWLKYAARLLQLADWPGILDVIFDSNEAGETTSLNALGWTEHPSTMADRRHRLIWSIIQSISQLINQKLNQNHANVATYRHVSLSVFAVLSYASTVYAVALCLSVRLSQIGVLSKQPSYMLCGVRAGNCGWSPAIMNAFGEQTESPIFQHWTWVTFWNQTDPIFAPTHGSYHLT